MTFVGALILGLAEAYVAGYLTPASRSGALELGNLRYAISPIVLFVVMVVLPQARAAGRWRAPHPRGLGACRRCTRRSRCRRPRGGHLGAERSDARRHRPDPVLHGFFFALVALSLVPLTGYAGQISLAQMTFAGIGGVLMAMVGADRTPLGLFIAVVVTALVGVLVALPALRLSGIYLALGDGGVLPVHDQVVFLQAEGHAWQATARCPPLELRGVRGQLEPGSAHGADERVRRSSASAWSRCVASSCGRRLSAMKDSPVACATLGLDLTRTKVAVFALSAAHRRAGRRAVGPEHPDDHRSRSTPR